MLLDSTNRSSPGIMEGRGTKEAWHSVFVYGTLKSGESFNHVLTDATKGQASLVGPAKTVKKWPLVLVSSLEIPCLLPYEGQGHEVFGEVYDVDDRMLEFLDRIESHPDFYARSLEDVELLTHPQPAHTEAESALNSSCSSATASDDISHSLPRRKVWIYIMRRTQPELLSLPHMANYTGKRGIELPFLTGDDSLRFLTSQFRNASAAESCNNG
ncbi:hypothetical protein V5799_008587 [Amblyomma americanum]|uniref:Gamma-glutamylcyclotransferase family protein n=1 Tax=Amblyomma americanum TaxID=6943 RepID=A0AAQ4FE90_AMBAM